MQLITKPIIDMFFYALKVHFKIYKNYSCIIVPSVLGYLHFVLPSYTHARTHTHIQTHTHAHTHTHIHARTHARTHTHARAHTHKHTHTHIHTHTHTYTARLLVIFIIVILFEEKKITSGATAYASRETWSIVSLCQNITFHDP